MALMVFCLVGTLAGWRQDHAELTSRMAKSENQIRDLQSSSLTAMNDLNKLDAEKNKLWSQYNSETDQEIKVIDQRNKFSDEVEALTQENAILKGKVDSEETDIKSLQHNLEKVTEFYQETYQHYQDTVALDKERATNFNELLADYKSLCARANQPFDPPGLNSQLTGDAAREFAPAAPAPIVIQPNSPPSSTATILDHGDGVYSVIGQ